MIVRQKIARPGWARVTTEDLESHFWPAARAEDGDGRDCRSQGGDRPALEDSGGRRSGGTRYSRCGPHEREHRCPTPPRGGVPRRRLSQRHSAAVQARVTVRPNWSGALWGHGGDNHRPRRRGYRQGDRALWSTRWCYNLNLFRDGAAQLADSQTAFEIVSIDIADIEVGGGIAAKLAADQAAADLRAAQPSRKGVPPRGSRTGDDRCSARNRPRWCWPRPMPLAIAQAFKDGRLGVMDYNLKNLRRHQHAVSIAGPNSDGQNNR